MSSSRQTIRAVPDPVTDETPTVAALAPSPQVALGERDVRAKRPPLLSFLLRWETVRRFSRVVVLMALDFAGVFLAIFTALLLKDVVHAQTRTQVVAQAFHQTRGFVAFAYLVTMLLFARSDMYADRGERPGFTRILATLFQVTVVALIFALVNGDEVFLLLLRLLRLVLLRADLPDRLPPGLRADLWAAAACGRLSAARGARRHRRAYRRGGQGALVRPASGGRDRRVRLALPASG